MWEKEIDIRNVQEIRTRNVAYLGVGAIEKIDAICADLASRGVRHVLCVTGHGAYKTTGAWDHVTKAFAAHGMDYVLYDKITPNPKVEDIDEAVAMGRAKGASAVVAIGGGSPIDAGKSAAILLSYPDKNATELYELIFTPTKAAPLVAINLTHGTGTEVDRFAVASIVSKKYKPAIAYDCIYPVFAIDDPALMTGLSAFQTRYVSIDACNHVIEAATTKIFSSPYSIMMAAETIELVDRWLPVALKDPKDLQARYFLLYASMIAGIAFDNGMLHLTHALEHPLSAVKPDLTHGLGLAMLLPSVIEEIWPARAETLRRVLAPMLPADFPACPTKAKEAADHVEAWLFKMGATHKLIDEGYTEADIDTLVRLTRETPSLGGLLDLSPVEATPELVGRIYRTSLRRRG
ncbi:MULTISPECIES: iron-containing alcohol dehydrogenase [Jonquetella]|uniref:Alcohol dehydrogenase, class IV n=1 Tax=Jonquetella anthropi DSM 22815 TaxID=885272 RepID=H0ULB2_9BACT|nr:MULTISPECIES: iron-containing alcohol dehydrogenase [Jonquetella]EEX48033.1 alcohol dehydrogenase, iron-dependent [Jonquetella anthropi E3_33 E1]EHM13471.1 alcohol dehydrogenase, class IV [Jonquetella anthropi DSM 22815]ERL24422.1 alcohol dehydrogenase, iron-dependent [Jonquetella sp. BV3C21]